MLHHLYRSTAMNNALEILFGREQKLFGDVHSRQRHLNKVAVPVATELGTKPLLICNYNREWLMNDDDSEFRNIL